MVLQTTSSEHLDAKYKVLDDAERDALITGNQVQLGSRIYHATDNKLYWLQEYPTVGSTTGAVWQELGDGAVLTAHIGDTSNPHLVIPSQLGLGNVDNTSDADKPISTAQQTALDLKENVFSKNTAFNKNFGTASDTIVEGDDSRVLNGQIAYNKKVNSVTVTGTNAKTLTLTLQDGNTLTAGFNDIDTDDDVFLNGISFNTSDGQLTVALNDTTTVSTDLDGRFSLLGHTHIISEITDFTDNSTNWNTAFGWGDHAGLYSLLSHTHTFASLTSKPTTIGGYGITDYNSLWDTQLATKTTNNLIEGSNLYYTTTRANSAIDTRVNQSFINALDINATTLDTLDSSQFLRSDVDDTFNGDLIIDKTQSLASDFLTPLMIKRSGGTGVSTDMITGFAFQDFNSIQAGIYANRTRAHLNYGSDLEFYTNNSSSSLNPQTALVKAYTIDSNQYNTWVNGGSFGGDVDITGKLSVTGGVDVSSGLSFINDTDTRFIMSANGTFQWGATAGQYGNLSWDTTEAIIGSYSNRDVAIRPNGTGEFTVHSSSVFKDDVDIEGVFYADSGSRIGTSTITTTVPTFAVSDTTNGGSLTIRGLSPVLSFDATGGGSPTILTDGETFRFMTGTLDSFGTDIWNLDSSGNTVQIGGATFGGDITLAFQKLLKSSGNNSIELYDGGAHMNFKADSNINFDIDTNNNSTDTAHYRITRDNETTELYKLLEDGSSTQLAGATFGDNLLINKATGGQSGLISIDTASYANLGIVRDSYGSRFSSSDTKPVYFNVNSTTVGEIDETGYSSTLGATFGGAANLNNLATVKVNSISSGNSFTNQPLLWVDSAGGSDLFPAFGISTTVGNIFQVSNAGNMTLTGTANIEDDVQIGNQSKLSVFLDRVLTVGTSSSGQQGGIEIVGNQTSDTVVSALTFNNTQSLSTDKRIAQITSSRDGDNSIGTLNFTLWTGQDTTTTPLSLRSYGVDISGKVEILDSDTSVTGDGFTFKSNGDAVLKVWSDYNDNSNVDAYGQFGVGVSSGENPEHSWYYGLDASDNSFNIGYQANSWGAPGSNDLFSISTTGQVKINTTSDNGLHLNGTDTIMRILFEDPDGSGWLQWHGSSNEFNFNKDLSITGNMTLTGDIQSETFTLFDGTHKATIQNGTLASDVSLTLPIESGTLALARNIGSNLKNWEAETLSPGMDAIFRIFDGTIFEYIGDFPTSNTFVTADLKAESEQSPARWKEAISSFPAVEFANLTPRSIQPNTIKFIQLDGEYIKKGTTVDLGTGFDILSYTYESSNRMLIEVQSIGSLGYESFPIINNGREAILSEKITISDGELFIPDSTGSPWTSKNSNLIYTVGGIENIFGSGSTNPGTFTDGIQISEDCTLEFSIIEKTGTQHMHFGFGNSTGSSEILDAYFRSYTSGLTFGRNSTSGGYSLTTPFAGSTVKLKRIKQTANTCNIEMYQNDILIETFLGISVTEVWYPFIAVWEIGKVENIELTIL